MNENILNKSASDLMAVATRLARKRHNSSSDLYRIAQSLIDGSGAGTNVTGLADSDPTLAAGAGFDPSAEQSFGDGVSMGVQEMSGGHDGGSGGEERGGNHMHPKIDSYVSDNPQAGMVDDRKTHTLQCTLKAPEDISESDMMNYILGIAKVLNVDVDSFRWSKSEPKLPSGGNGGNGVR